MNYILIGIALLTTVIVMTVVAYRKGKAKGLHDNNTDQKKKNAKPLRDISSRDQQVLNLQDQINTLNDLNGSYLTFMFRIPSIVQSLNASQDFDEVISSIISLVKEIISTETVKIHLFDKENNIVREISPYRETVGTQCT